MTENLNKQEEDGLPSETVKQGAGSNKTLPFETDLTNGTLCNIFRSKGATVFELLTSNVSFVTED